MPGHAQVAFGFPDLHWCNRDKDALKIAMKCHAAIKPDITMVGGDVWDATPFCRFGRTPGDLDGYRTFASDELLPVSDWMGDLEKNTKKLVWLEGNHDAWIDRWIANLPGIAHLGREMIRLPSEYIKQHHPKLELFPFIPATDQLVAYPLHKNLGACHGWCATKFAARRHLELSKSRSIIFHHTHREQVEVTRDPYSGAIIEASSCGCLCKLVPIWRHGVPTDWVHGCWIVYLGKRTYTRFNIRIFNGRAVLPSGEEIRP